MSLTVLHVAHHMSPHIGGLEAIVDAEAVGLRERGWRVSLLTSACGLPAGTLLDERGFRTVRVRAWNGLEERFGVPFPVFEPRLLVDAFREVRRADIVHVHDVLYISSWVTALWCWLLRTPYVLHRHVGFVHHSSPIVRLVQRIVVGTVGKWTLRRAAAVLAIDDYVADSVRPALPDPEVLEVLRNGVDTNVFTPTDVETRGRTRERYGLPADRVLALFVGRFVPKKGFDLVAAARGRDYDLVFVGGSRPPGLDDSSLHFLGGVPKANMPAVYAAADIMLIASVGECPLTVLEAMSSGLPLLVNDDPGLRSSPWISSQGASEGDDPLVRWVDMAAGGLAERLRDLAGSEPQRRALGSAGLRAAQEWSWRGHVDQLERVYRRTVPDRSRC